MNFGAMNVAVVAACTRALVIDWPNCHVTARYKLSVLLLVLVLLL